MVNVCAAAFPSSERSSYDANSFGTFEAKFTDHPPHQS
jgi:hypothetical protein